LKKKGKKKVIFTFKLTSTNNKCKSSYKLNATNEEKYFILQEFCKLTTMLLEKNQKERLQMLKDLTKK